MNINFVTRTIDLIDNVAREVLWSLIDIELINLKADNLLAFQIIINFI